MVVMEHKALIASAGYMHSNTSDKQQVLAMVFGWWIYPMTPARP